VKQAFAILFALALVMSQPLAAGVLCAGPASCCSCGGKMKCCLAESGNTSQETPAAPASTPAQKNFQAALWLVVHMTTPAIGKNSRVAATISSPAAYAVPLFTRDCAYLL
jgi:hypothetical protein